MRLIAPALVAGLVTALAAPGLAAPRRPAPAAFAAQMGRDPLNPAEADQVRDTSNHLDQRVPLLVQFAAARLAKFQQIRTASPRPPGRDADLYSLLQQYAAILPELDDAVDDLASGVTTSEGPKKYKDAKKVLTAAVLAVQGLQTTLQQIQTQSSAADLANYHFELDNCLDVTSDSLQNVQDALKPGAGQNDAGIQ